MSAPNDQDPIDWPFTALALLALAMTAYGVALWFAFLTRSYL